MTAIAKSGISKYKVLLINHSHTPIPEPHSVSEAILIPEWKDVMQQEYDALSRNNTWTLVPRLADVHPITSKWLFRVKYNKNDSVEWYKARLVARRFQQQAGVDYFHTFSPVIKPVTLRVVFSLAVTRGWSIQQVDINNAFLNGDLHKTVYLEQTEGFVSDTNPPHVCKLLKALYGLK